MLTTALRHILRTSALLVVIVAIAGLGSLGTADVALAAPANASANAPTLPVTTCSPSCELYATTGSVTLPDGANVPIWGFTDVPGGPAQLPGPALIVNQGEAVTVILNNNLGENVSLAFPGQDLVPDLVGAPAGGTVSYTFTPSEPGTYSYEAGLTTNGARQVAMGLFGAFIVRPAGQPNWAYDANSAFDVEALLVFNEIDPDFNFDPFGFSMKDFKAEYWLINGEAYPDTDVIPTAPGNRVLLRYLNGGVRSRYVGVLGLDQEILGIDSSQLPYTYTAVSEALGAGQSLDALVTIPVSASEGERYALYNPGRQLHNAGALAANGSVAFGGILTFLEVAGGLPIPDVGPLASNAQVVPNPTTGANGVTLSADLDETSTGGSNVVAWEFFINDLGLDGTSPYSFTVPGPAPLVAVSTLVSSDTLQTLPAGDVTFYVHGQDSNGNWGPVSSAVLDLVVEGPMIQGITLSPNPTNGTADVALSATADDRPTGDIDVVAAEYFIDTPGGDGTGTPMDLNQAPAPVVGLDAVIPAAVVDGLSEGAHTIYIHGLDDLGNWGGWGTIDLVVDKTGPNAIGTSLVPNPSNGMIPVNPYAYAVRLIIIVGDSFLEPSLIERAEAFIDYAGPVEDPDGSGIPLIASDALYNATIEEAYVDIPLTTIRQLAEGSHTIDFHGKDVAGNWGLINSMTLVVDKTGPNATNLNVEPDPTAGSSVVQLTAIVQDPANGGAPASNIVAAEWFEGTDPGPGNGGAMLAVDGLFDSPSEDVEATINVTGWANGNHVISVRAKDLAGNWGAVGTVNLTVSGNVPGGILGDGFETGNFVAWGSAIGSVSVVPEAAMERSLGMKAELNGSAPAYLVDRTPSAESRYRVRFYFNPNGADTQGSSHDIFVGRNAEGTQIFGIQFEQGASGPEVRAWVRQAGVETFTNWYHIANASQMIGMSWKSSADASFSLSVDGVEQEALSGLDTAAYQLEEVWLGPSGGIVSGMTGAEYFDGFFSSRILAGEYRIYLPMIRR